MEIAKKPKRCVIKRRAHVNSAWTTKDLSLTLYLGAGFILLGLNHVSMERNGMKKQVALLALALSITFCGASRSQAEVKRVEMHIAGYLCGN